MKLVQSIWLARLALLVLTAIGVGWLARLDFGAIISTNVVDLIPQDEREPELHLLRTLANEEQARVVLLALAVPGDSEPPEAAAAAMVEVLAASPEFAEVRRTDDPEARNALGAFLYEHRFEYLLPDWLERQRRRFADSGWAEARWSAWLAGEVAAGMDRFLATPASTAFEELIPRDPLLLIPELARTAEMLEANHPEAPRHALIWTRIVESPMENAGQEPVFAAIEKAFAAARAIAPEAELRWTGVNRFAAASKARIRAEITGLNVASLLMVLLVTGALIRRPWRVLHLAPVVLLALLGAWTVVTMVFDRLHIMVFVIGALLIGAAIDYGFHLYLHALQTPDEPYGRRLRRVARPLLTSCLTTVIGFSLLLFSDLPLIRHLGVFVSAGLISALIAAVLYFAQLGSGQLEARLWPVWRWSWSMLHWRPLFIIVIGVAALLGLMRLRWHDDIRELQVPSPALQVNDSEVREMFGDTHSQTAYLTRGDSVAEARQRAEAFAQWHDHRFPSTTLGGAIALLPAPTAYAALPERLVELTEFPEDLRRALDQRGYVPGEFEPFFTAWRQQIARTDWRPYNELVQSLEPHLKGPLALMIGQTPGNAWLLSIGDHPPDGEPPPALATVTINQLQSLNRLFARYRENALWLSLGGLGLVGVSVVVCFGLRRGLRIFAVPVAACLLALAVLGLAGVTLNLFHLLGAFLGVCLSHDYAIFTADMRTPGAPPPASVRLAALTTATSFGVLAFSQIPVISALGSSVTLIVLIALVLVELSAAQKPV